LPKICGNIASVHASAGLALLLLSGCSAPEPQEILLPLTVHSLDSCPIPTPARVDLSALGDFPTSNDTTPTVSLTAQNVRLGFPSETLALEAIAHPEASDQAFIGYGERGELGLDFLLWPKESHCELYRAASYPAGLGGEGLGFASDIGLLLMAGSEGFSSSAVVGAMTFDGRTGQSAAVEPRAAMRKPRAYASVSGFGDQVLVSGGEYPIHESDTPASVLNDDAEVYDPVSASFEPDFVPLSLAVARHASVLLESGEVALIGGETEASRASTFIQAVSPLTRTTKVVGTLALGRSEPTVLRLDDGRLFIAGGLDAAGSPVGALEWRAADASPLPAPFDGTLSLPPRFDRAYATLAGGAVLAVGGCQDRAPRAGENCARECQRGCPPLLPGSEKAGYEAFWISADGVVTALDFPLEAAHPSLLGGSDGAPWLIAEDSELFRFDPWHATFDATTIPLGLNGAQSPARFQAMGTDSFAWLTQDDSGIVLQGLRLGTRSAFSNDVPLVTLRDENDPSRPAHLVPDRAPSAQLSYEDAGSGALVFAQSAPDEAKPCVWISDARYSDFTAEISFSSGESPSLRLGGTQFVAAEASDAGGSCLLPPLGADGQGDQLVLERIGNQARLTLGAAHSNCTVGAGRLPLAVCASELGGVRVTRLSVERRQ
jgi:hypothetical protein